MKPYVIHKYAYSDKNTEELQFNLAFYNSRLALLTEELVFFKHLLSSNCFAHDTPNLSEKIESFNKQIDQQMKLTASLSTVIEKQYKEVELKIECDDLSCDNYFLKQYHETELELIAFLNLSGDLKSEIMTYTKGIIL